MAPDETCHYEMNNVYCIVMYEGLEPFGCQVLVHGNVGEENYRNIVPLDINELNEKMLPQILENCILNITQ